MKLLMLGWELPPHNSGGLGVACFHMAKALSGCGVDIDFVLPGDEDYSDIDFMNVYTVPTGRKLLGRNKITSTRSETRTKVLNAYTGDADALETVNENYLNYLEKMLKDKDYDAIHCHDWLTMRAGIKAKKILGKPLVVQVHATEFDRSGGGRGNPLIHEIEEAGLLAADRIIAVSELTKSIIVREYHIPAEKIEVVRNAIDPDELRAIPMTNDHFEFVKLLKSEGYTVVASLGRLTLQKGLTFLMNAFSKAVRFNPKMLLIVAGSGEQRDELFELAASYGIVDKVIFTGFVRGSKMREVYALADIFVMSSISEPFGLTTLEAAAHDDALIITKTSGVSESLRNVFLYDFWDTDKLADELVNLAESPALMNTLKSRVASEFDAYSWDNAAAGFMSAYRKVMKMGRSYA